MLRFPRKLMRPAMRWMHLEPSPSMLIDNRSSSTITHELTGWQPVQAALLADVEDAASGYFG